jgi:hypothetical protein
LVTVLERFFLYPAVLRGGQKIHGGGFQETIFDSSGRKIRKSRALREAL